MAADAPGTGLIGRPIDWTAPQRFWPGCIMHDTFRQMEARDHKIEPSPVEAPTTAGRLDDQLCFALYAATNAITRAYRPMLTELGLTYPQYLVLLVLWEHRSRTVGAIAADLRLATHAVSPIAERLEEAGLVRRVRSLEDGRVVNVELTDAGARLEAAVPGIQEALRCRTLMADADIARLQAELIALADRVRGA